ncbi:MAG: DGQHR domain-containing protein [Nitratireductor sp.]
MSMGLDQLVDPDPQEIEIRCLRAEQPIGEIFIASIDYRTLIKITHFDVRRVIQDERDVERYLGIQRPLNDKRVKELKRYVNYFDASFPTAVIIAIDAEHATYDPSAGVLRVSNVRHGEERPDVALVNIARVIDGQHRIAGLADFKGEKFDVPVTIFVGADIADQAHIFATVNLEQSKVNRSLAYDLYALATSRSPQKTCHNIAVVLDQDEASPFYRRIKRLGVATVGREFEPISQAAFVESLIGYISRDPKQDRDRILKARNVERASDQEARSLLFRNMFIEGRDLDIAQVIFDYFSAIRARWPEAWNEKRKGYILARTNGFRAFMRALKDVYAQLDLVELPATPEYFREFLASVPLRDDQFNTEEFPPGSGGEGRLYRVIVGEESLS